MLIILVYLTFKLLSLYALVSKKIIEILYRKIIISINETITLYRKIIEMFQ